MLAPVTTGLSTAGRRSAVAKRACTANADGNIASHRQHRAALTCARTAGRTWTISATGVHTTPVASTAASSPIHFAHRHRPHEATVCRKNPVVGLPRRLRSAVSLCPFLPLHLQHLVVPMINSYGNCRLILYISVVNSIWSIRHGCAGTGLVLTLRDPSIGGRNVLVILVGKINGKRAKGRLKRMQFDDIRQSTMLKDYGEVK